MNAMTFKYHKDTNITDRVFIPITSPTDKYFGIDITELDAEDQGLFDTEYQDLVDEHKEKIEALMEKYDLNYKYRSFFANKMTDIKFE